MVQGIEHAGGDGRGSFFFFPFRFFLLTQVGGFFLFFAEYGKDVFSPSGFLTEAFLLRDIGDVLHFGYDGRNPLIDDVSLALQPFKGIHDRAEKPLLLLQQQAEGVYFTLKPGGVRVAFQDPQCVADLPSPFTV